MALNLQMSIGSDALKTKKIGIPLTAGVTAISGDSGAGKTYLYNALEELGEYNGMRIITINSRNYRLLKSLNTAFNSDIVVIDEIEIIRMLYPECLREISAHYEPIILFGRALEGIRVDSLFYFELIFENKELYLKTVIGQARVPESGENPLLDDMKKRRRKK